MADLKYTVSVDSAGGVSSLRNLQSQVAKTQSSFDGFSRVIGGLAIGATVGRLLSLSNNMTDLSAATGFAVQSIVGFSQAVQQNGASLEAGQAGLQRFTRFLGEVQSGSKTFKDSLNQLGIAQESLAQQSPEEALKRVVDALARLDSASLRGAISTEIFGRSFATVDLVGVARNFDRLRTQSLLTAEAIESAGAVSQSLADSTTLLQFSLLRALKPAADLTLEFTRNQEKMQDLIDTTIRLGTVIGGLVAFGFIVRQFAALGVAIVAVSAGFTKFISGAGGAVAVSAGLGTSLLRLVPILGKIYIAWELLAAGLRLVLDIDIKQWVSDSIDSLKEMLPSLEDIRIGILGLVGADTDRLRAESANNQVRLGLHEDIKEMLAAVADSQEGITVSINGTNGALARTVSLNQEITGQYREQAAAFLENFRIENTRITMTDGERRKSQTFMAFEADFMAQKEAIQKRISELQANPADTQAPEKIRELEKALGGVLSEYELHRTALEGLTQQRERQLQIADAQRSAERDLANLTWARESAEKTIADMRLDNAEKIDEMYSSAEMSGLNEIGRQLKQIEIDENRVAAAARRRIADQFGDLDPAGLKRSMEEINQLSQDAIQSRSGAAQRIYEEQRTFASGWSRAFTEYSDAATNASTQAERIFRETTQGMEDAIVTFAKTGKFEWRGFVATILEELLRNNIRQLISSTFGSIGMGSTNTQSQGRQSPQTSSGGGGIGQIISTVGNLFAGFFATGGTIPAGRYGVVGESGPELVSGPATVTPMSGQSVTYNINAVDAVSFQTLLARDPGLIYALTEQGRSRAPVRRR